MEYYLYMAIASFVAILVIRLVRGKKKLFQESLEGKHLLISGGSSGIGLAIAGRALSEKAFVTLMSRSATKLSLAAQTLVEQTGCSPDQIKWLVADVGDYKAVSKAVKEAQEWKVIDILVCNAGVTKERYLEQTPIEDLHLTVQTNLMGTIHLIHAVLPAMKQHCDNRPSSIVIMSSMAAIYLLYGHTVYTATKYAVRGLAEGLRLELAPFNIRINLICPSWVRTPFLDDAEKGRDVLRIMKWVNLYDRKRVQTPESVAMYTLEAVKEGSFLVTTKPIIGFYLKTMARGTIPSESLLNSLLEAICFLPFRLHSIIVAHATSNLVQRLRRKHAKH